MQLALDESRLWRGSQNIVVQIVKKIPILLVKLLSKQTDHLMSLRTAIAIFLPSHQHQ
jgi:hypothetical protein